MYENCNSGSFPPLLVDALDTFKSSVIDKTRI